MQEFAVIVGGRRVTLARYRGELDPHAAARLRARLAAVSRATTDVVLVDLSRATSVDCAALIELVDLARDCGRADVGLAVSGLPPFTRRLLGLIDRTGILHLVDDMVAATRWAARWIPAGPPPGDAPRSPVLPPGPRRHAPTGPDRPWPEWR